LPHIPVARVLRGASFIFLQAIQGSKFKPGSDLTFVKTITPAILQVLVVEKMVLGMVLLNCLSIRAIVFVVPMRTNVAPKIFVYFAFLR